MKNTARENYSWGLILDLIEREIQKSFKIRKPHDDNSESKTTRTTENLQSQN